MDKSRRSTDGCRALNLMAPPPCGLAALVESGSVGWELSEKRGGHDDDDNYSRLIGSQLDAIIGDKWCKFPFECRNRQPGRQIDVDLSGSRALFGRTARHSVSIMN